MDNTLFSTAMMLVDKIMSQSKKEDFLKPTPCAKWNVRDLANHMLNELAWISPLLKGKTIKEVGSTLDGDLIKDDVFSSWTEYCKQASKQMAKTDPDSIVHLSYGDKPAQAYIDEVSADLIIHGWDLAQALYVPYEIDEKVAAAVKQATKDIMPSGRVAGYVGKELEAEDDADAQEKLLAYYGRSKSWR